MTTEPPTERQPVGQSRAAGVTLGAAVLLLISAVLMVLVGISGVFNDEVLVAGVPGYLYKFNATAWGWVLIVVAVLTGLAAIAVFFGVKWGRLAAIVMAAVSIVVMFMAIPYYWAWAFVVIVLDVVVIWGTAKFWWTEHTDSAASLGFPREH